MVFENNRKTEIVALIMENYKLTNGRDLPVNFNDKYGTLRPALTELIKLTPPFIVASPTRPPTVLRGGSPSLRTKALQLSPA